MVTLWREQAETVGAQLEALTNPVIVMTKMRIGDFNGVSVSSSYASRFEINPEGYTEVKTLQDWWAAEGSTVSFAPAGMKLNHLCAAEYAHGLLHYLSATLTCA